MRIYRTPEFGFASSGIRQPSQYLDTVDLTDISSVGRTGDLQATCDVLPNSRELDVSKITTFPKLSVPQQLFCESLHKPFPDAGGPHTRSSGTTFSEWYLQAGLLLLSCVLAIPITQYRPDPTAVTNEHCRQLGPSELTFEVVLF